jgi:hypothetical protein
MPKKLSPSHRLKNEIIRTYRARFNSPEELSAALGVSSETAKEYLETIASGRYPITDPDEATQFLDRLEAAPKFFSGENTMELVYEKTGKHYLIEDYKIEPGASLPSTIVTDNAYAYQIIIIGEDRKVTTTFAGDPESALSAARKDMSRYFRFQGSEYILRVLADNEDYEGE